MDVLPMLLIVAAIAHPMVNVATLPNFGDNSQLFLHSKRKATFDELHCSLERGFFPSGDEQVDVIWHHDEFVQSIFFLIAVMNDRRD